jgi:hypothetical protein
MNDPLKILVKYPTRERASQFIKTLYLYRSLCADKANTRIVVTVDADDNRKDQSGASMAEVRNKGLTWPDTGEPIGMQVHHGTGKIRAINYGIEQLGEWDIVLLASDDMEPQVDGYDNLIREAFGDNLDQCLWINDGRQDRICTIVCMGRTYYNRFGYLYHPSYKSLWCDNEQTEVAVTAGKMVNAPCWIKNESPDWGGSQKKDAMYRRNNGWYNVDRKNYERRKALGFPI